MRNSQKLKPNLTLRNIRYYTLPFSRPFSQRKLVATIDRIEIGGWVDYMLASGKQKHIHPFFFLHLYKQETKKGSSDPKGQLLSEMLVAQHFNGYLFPIYGCFVLGRSWFFMVLNNKEYAVSNAYNASNEDLYQIIAILQRVKDYIAEIVQNLNTSTKQTD